MTITLKMSFCNSDVTLTIAPEDLGKQLSKQGFILTNKVNAPLNRREKEECTELFS